jgi:hypothetical protein
MSPPGTLHLPDVRIAPYASIRRRILTYVAGHGQDAHDTSKLLLGVVAEQGVGIHEGTLSDNRLRIHVDILHVKHEFVAIAETQAFLHDLDASVLLITILSHYMLRNYFPDDLDLLRGAVLGDDTGAMR